MFRSIRLLVAVALCSLFLSSCLYVNTTIPLDINLDETHLGDKVGESSMQSAIWLFTWGDGGTKAAAENGGITRINHADRRFRIYFFGIYASMTTVVYGE